MAILSKITSTIKNNGGHCHLEDLIAELAPYYDKESILQCINSCFPKSPEYQGKADIFCIIKKSKKGGIWALRKRSNTTYKTLITEYLILNDSADIDELYEYIQSFLETKKYGKTYLKHFLTHEFRDSVIFDYSNNTFSLKSRQKKQSLESFIDNLAAGKQVNTYSFRFDKKDPHGRMTLPESRVGEITERKILTSRSNKLISDVVKLRDNHTCQCCGFSFRKMIVEPHILNPLEASENKAINSENLITLCPNCHFLAHILIEYDLKYMDKDELLNKLKELHSICTETTI